MVTWIQVLVSSISLFVLTVDGATLTRTPTAIEVGKTDTLTLRCSSNMVFSTLFVVQILKYVEGLNDQNTRVLAEIAPGEQAKLTYSPLVQRATVSGTTTGTRFLQLVIRNLICADGGMYICKFTGQDSSSNQIDDTQSENVTASAQPGEAKMFPRPDFESYTANKTVEMRCTGNVGNPPKSWLWQWKFPNTNSWSTYPYRDQIKDETPVKDSSGCQNTGATVLNYVTRLEDNSRIIRCSLGGNDAYSANKTIYITAVAGGATLTTNPSTIEIGKTDTLTLRCSSSMAFTDLFVVQIMKYMEGLNDKNARTLAQMKPTVPAKIVYESLATRATASGSITGSRYLQLVIRNLVCADGGMYICKYAGLDNTDRTITDIETENVTASAQPGEVKMFPRPDFGSYTANKTVEIRCTGNVGNPPKSWLWQWKFPSTNSWSTYPYRDQIKDETPVKDSSGCQNTGATVLDYVTRLEDNSRIIRCCLDGNDAYSANKTVYITGMEGPTTPKTGGSEASTPLPGSVRDNMKNKTSVNLAAVIAGTLTSAVVLLSAIGAVLVWRRRQTWLSKETKEGNTADISENAPNAAASDEYYSVIHDYQTSSNTETKGVDMSEIIINSTAADGSSWINDDYLNPTHTGVTNNTYERLAAQCKEDQKYQALVLHQIQSN